MNPEEFEKFKAHMKVFGYGWFQVKRTTFYGDEISVRERMYDCFGWPALWDVCKVAKIYTGCGDTFFHQIDRGSLPLGDYTL